jgi:hypothetical protein
MSKQKIRIIDEHSQSSAVNVDICGLLKEVLPVVALIVLVKRFTFQLSRNELCIFQYESVLTMVHTAVIKYSDTDFRNA